jgi:hypothetical protein
MEKLWEEAFKLEAAARAQEAKRNVWAVELKALPKDDATLAKRR